MNETNHATHDLELLSALASGYEPDRDAAEGLLASCEECRVIHAEQVQMRSLLAAAGPAQLSAAEQARLVAAVGAAVPARLQRLNPRSSRPLSPIWGRVLATAAGLAVVIGVGATLASQQDAEVAFATTTAAATAAAPEFAVTDERAAATTAATDSIFGLAADGDLSALKTEAEELANQDTAGQSAEATTSCAEEIADLSITARGESTYQDRPVLLLLVEDDGENSPRAFYLDDCTEIPLP